jgi:hypothetical protein
MPELSSIEAFGLGIGVHWSRGAMAHFTPLDPTFNHLRAKRSIKIFSRFAPVVTTWNQSTDQAPLLRNGHHDVSVNPVLAAVTSGTLCCAAAAKFVSSSES